MISGTRGRHRWGKMSKAGIQSCLNQDCFAQRRSGGLYRRFHTLAPWEKEVPRCPSNGGLYGRFHTPAPW